MLNRPWSLGTCKARGFIHVSSFYRARSWEDWWIQTPRCTDSVAYATYVFSSNIKTVDVYPNCSTKETINNMFTDMLGFHNSCILFVWLTPCIVHYYIYLSFPYLYYSAWWCNSLLVVSVVSAKYIVLQSENFPSLESFYTECDGINLTQCHTCPATEFLCWHHSER